MLKKLFQLSVVFIMTFFITLVVRAEGFSLGFVTGSQTGFSYKYRLSAMNSIDGALSYSHYGEYGHSLHANYIFDRARIFDIGEIRQVEFYYGLGGLVSNINRGRHDGHTELGIRAPFGVLKSITRPDLDFFAELAPVLQFIKDSDVYMTFGVGLRYRF